MPKLNGRVELVGYTDSDWAGGAGNRTGQSCGKIFADGVPVNSFSKRQSVIATSSGIAEIYAAAAAVVAGHPLRIKTVLVSSPMPKANLTPLRRRRIGNSQEVGRVRSLETRVLQLQQAFRRG